jgi:DNA polymerase (family 10)
MARGLDPARLREQWAEIDRINAAETDGFRVLKGIECDILEAGGMDLPDDVLAEADWVNASIHYGQTQSSEQLTARIVGALEHPSVCVVAHPTGRVLNARPSYELDFDAVFDAAVKNKKFLELNASPERLDLSDLQCTAAKQRGIPIVISTDAHKIATLDNVRYGILQARRAGLTAADVVNTRSWEEIQAMLGRG